MHKALIALIVLCLYFFVYSAYSLRKLNRSSSPHHGFAKANMVVALGGLAVAAWAYYYCKNGCVIFDLDL